MKNRLLLILLLSILLLGVFMRLYQASERFEFSHDGDLYSWIVKDMVVDKHPRLIGQITSTEGIYIGGLFYYLLIPFYILNGMDPSMVYWMGVVVGVATIISFYFVFNRLFGTVAGLIAAYLQSVMISRVVWDRWIVPTVTSHLWEIWFLYVVVMIARGSWGVLPLLGVLIALIWHINFSLMPTLLALPVAAVVSRKRPTLKQIVWGFVTFFVVMIPMLVFEAKHNFVQFSHFVTQFGLDQGGGSGIDKFNHVLQQVSGNVTQMFFYPERLDYGIGKIVMVAGVLLGVFASWRKVLRWGELVALTVWVVGMIVYFSVSSKITTEYYFTNIDLVYFAFFTLALVAIFKLNRVLSFLVIGLLLFVGAYGIYVLVVLQKDTRSEFRDKKAIVEFIKQDATKRGFPCIGVSHNSEPGRELGYRYLFYLSGLKLRSPSIYLPVYNIAFPESKLKNSDVAFRAGPIGLMLPPKGFDGIDLSKQCEGDNVNLTDSFFGFVK